MTELDINCKHSKNYVIALGFFDSVHIGHRQIIERLKEYSQLYGCSNAVLTFENNPYPIMGRDIKLIYTYNERLSLLEKMGINAVIKTIFNEEFKNITANEFAKKLYNNFNIKHILCGYDFNFGQNAEGNTAFLKSFFDKHNIKVDVQQKITYDGKRVSSTFIRKLLLKGDIKNANKLLGEPYFVTGNVIHGDKLGAKLLYPTINIKPCAEKIELMQGVYSTTTEINGKTYKSVTNCGGKPTFDLDKYQIETYIIDYDGNLYNNKVKINFLQRLRGLIKFDNSEKLKTQIAKDIEKTKNIISKNYINFSGVL